MLYLESFRNQNNLVVVFDYIEIEEALNDIEFIMDLYLSQGVLFTYEILLWEFGCELVFNLKNGH